MSTTDIFRRFLRPALAFAAALAAVGSAGAKEYKTELAKGVEVVYLVNTTDKIARVKKVTDNNVTTTLALTIPKTVKYKSGGTTYTLTVVGICEDAFLHEWVENLHLPSTIKSIDKGAFRNSCIHTCAIPANVETIGDEAFYQSNLQGTLKIPAKCRRIGASAFSGTEITAIDYSEGGQEIPLAIGETAFSGSYVENVSMGRVSTLGEAAFGNCRSLRSINISGSVTKLPRCIFSGCVSLAQVGTPAITSIGEFAFHGCESLHEFNFLPGLKTIDGSAFQGCDLYGVHLPQGLETIGDEAFFSNPNLASVSFPASAKSIGDAAFQHCYKLTSVSCEAPAPPAMKDNSFHFYTGVTLWIPRAFVPAYERAEGWRCFDYSHLTSGIDSVSAGVGPSETLLLFDLQSRPVSSGTAPRGPRIELRGSRSRLVVK